MKKLLIGIPVFCVLLWGASSGNFQWTQFRSDNRHGTDTKGQSSDGTGTSGNVPKFNASGGLTDGGAVAANLVTSSSPGAGIAHFAGSTQAVTSSTVSLTADVTGVLPDANIAAGITRTIASGTSALGTSAISSAACATVVTTSATGTASTDAIQFTPNGSIKAITGYVPATTGGLTIAAYPTANNVNFDVCNWSSGSLTPGALTLNWRVVR